jgi:UDPglucose 6-dehydrogenase
MRITVIGTGYVGLVTGACLASLGHDLLCLDVDQRRIELLRQGQMPFYEPQLDVLAVEQVAAGRLAFTDSYEEAFQEAEAVFICVGTPSLPTGQPDTSAVEAAAEALGRRLGPDYCVVINKSTVPIGSGDWVGMLIRKGIAARPDDGPPPDFEVVSNPEFLREGSAIADALYPDRIVIGAESDRAVQRMRALYAPLLQRNAARGREVPFVVTDRASAEMIKYAANAFLATKISFINEIANICERVGADVTEVARGIGLDARIGRGFLNAGLGWGGSCFPKDLASLVHTAHEYGYDARLLAAVRDVNASQRLIVIRKLQERLKLLKGKTVTLWGLAFKPGTDDLRDAPALAIAARVTELGATVHAYDPQALAAARRVGVAAELFDDACQAARGADAVVLLTEWPEFTQVDWRRLHSMMRRPLIIDGRNALDRATLLEHGFEYCGIGI